MRPGGIVGQVLKVSDRDHVTILVHSFNECNYSGVIKVLIPLTEICDRSVEEFSLLQAHSAFCDAGSRGGAGCVGMTLSILAVHSDHQARAVSRVM